MRPATQPRDKRSAAKLLVLPAESPEPTSDAASAQVTPARPAALTTTVLSELPRFVAPGDLLVLNDAATLPASLRGWAADGRELELRLLGAGPPHGGEEVWSAVLLGAGDWRTATEHRPAPPPVQAGDRLSFAPRSAMAASASPPTLEAEVVQVSPQNARLLQVRFAQRGAAFLAALYALGRPIQYSYLKDELPLWSVQTVYSGRPWAAEMPSAGWSLSWQTLLALRARGVELAWLTHAAGISSSGDAELDALLPLPEQYELPALTIAAIERARRRGGRIIAVGTTVVRALEGAERSARQAGEPRGTLRAGRGSTSLRLDPQTQLAIVDGLLTGMHGPGESHFSLLSAFAPPERLLLAWQQASQAGFLCHEFGDVCLLFARRPPWQGDDRASGLRRTGAQLADEVRQLRLSEAF